jgi:hypothetical protein
MNPGISLAGLKEIEVRAEVENADSIRVHKEGIAVGE